MEPDTFDMPDPTGPDYLLLPKARPNENLNLRGIKMVWTPSRPIEPKKTMTEIDRGRFMEAIELFAQQHGRNVKLKQI